MTNKSIRDYPEVLTARMIAEYLGLGYVKTLNLIKYGGIPSIRIGNTFRISRKVFESWLIEPASKKLLT